MNSEGEHIAKIGDKVSYQNGSPTVHEGIIVAIKGSYLTIVAEGAEKELWDNGGNVGAFIHKDQIVSSEKLFDYEVQHDGKVMHVVRWRDAFPALRWLQRNQSHSFHWAHLYERWKIWEIDPETGSKTEIKP